MAAVVALAVALPLWTSGRGDPADTEAFQIAMETAPSRTTRSMGDQTAVVAQSSFADRAGRFCRDFVLVGSLSARGIACRSADGRWQVESQTDGGGQSINQQGIRTAAGEDVDALDQVYQQIGASDPFDKEKETRLIANGWRASPQE